MSEKDEGVGGKLAREMAEKTPSEAIADDLTGSGEPTAKQEHALQEKVDEEKRDTQ